jgi:hypothetical protein
VGPIDHADLTARFNALREVIQRDIKASQDLATVRMDASDAARIQHLAALAADRRALEQQITLVRELQDTYHKAMQHEVERQALTAAEAVRTTSAALQLQLDQRFTSESDARHTALTAATTAIQAALTAVQERAVLLQQELDRRLETTRREVEALEKQLNTRLGTVQREALAMQLQLDQRFETESEARRVALATATAAIQAALSAAETAVNKAEVATEKRFDGVNEFRRALTDQTATFPTRDEVNVRIEAISASVNRNTEALKDIELRFTSRLDLASGRTGGQAELAAESREERGLKHSSVQLIIAAVAVFLTLISITIAVVVSLHN